MTIYKEEPTASIHLSGKGGGPEVEEKVKQAKALLDEASKIDTSGTKYILLVCPKGSALNP